jgi:hypothetical protein
MDSTSSTTSVAVDSTVVLAMTRLRFELVDGVETVAVVRVLVEVEGADWFMGVNPRKARFASIISSKYLQRDEHTLLERGN